MPPAGRIRSILAWHVDRPATGGVDAIVSFDAEWGTFADLVGATTHAGPLAPGLR